MLYIKKREKIQWAQSTNTVWDNVAALFAGSIPWAKLRVKEYRTWLNTATWNSHSHTYTNLHTLRTHHTHTHTQPYLRARRDIQTYTNRSNQSLPNLRVRLCVSVCCCGHLVCMNARMCVNAVFVIYPYVISSLMWPLHTDIFFPPCQQLC